MQLKKLEVVGFKSFADRTEFHFDPGITGLVGPNGCGKTNVVDAIKWVLGTQSVKSLRGDEMLDVIFNGGSGRQPLGMAEVSLTFDNTDHKLPIEYDEVVVSRRLYRTGESEYLLNKQTCRLRDIKELFMDTGIGMQSYSIVEQGKIDVMLHANPKERRNIFEEAAGISKFRARRREAESKLERVGQDLLRVGDIVREVNREIRSIKLQAAKAERYQQILKDLAVHKLRLGLHQYRGLSKAHADLQEACTQAVGAQAEAEGRATAVRERLAEAEKAAAAAAAALEESGRRRAACEARAAAIDEATTAAKLRRDELARERTQRAQEAVEAKARIEALAAQEDKMLREQRACDLRLADLAREQQECQAIVVQAAQAAAEIAQTVEAKKAEAVDLLHKRARYQNELVAIETERKNLEAERARATARAENAGREAAEMESKRDALTVEYADVEAAIVRERAELTALEAKVRETKDLVDALATRMLGVHEQQTKQSSRKEFLEELERVREGYGAGTQAILTAWRKGDPRCAGVLGTVVDLCRVDSAQARLVDLALGDGAQAIVTETIAQAREVLGFSRETGVGRVQVIPLELATRIEAARRPSAGEAPDAPPAPRAPADHVECGAEAPLSETPPPAAAPTGLDALIDGAPSTRPDGRTTNDALAVPPSGETGGGLDALVDGAPSARPDARTTNDTLAVPPSGETGGGLDALIGGAPETSPDARAANHAPAGVADSSSPEVPSSPPEGGRNEGPAPAVEVVLPESSIADLVETTEPRFAPIVRLLLGSARSCADLESALASVAVGLDGSCFLTEAGELVTPHGAIIGGTDAGTTILSRRAELHDLDAGLRDTLERLGRLESEKSSQTQSLDSATRGCEGLRLLIYERNVAALEKRTGLEGARKRCQVLEEERNVVALEIAEIATQQRWHEEKAQSLGQFVADMDALALKIQSEVSELAAKGDSYEADRARAQQSLTEIQVKQAQAQERAEQLKVAAERLVKDREAAQQTLSTIDGILADIDRRAEAVARDLAERGKQREAVESEIALLVSERAGLTARAQAASDAETEAFSLVEEAETAIREAGEVLQTRRLEERESQVRLETFTNRLNEELAVNLAQMAAETPPEADFPEQEVSAQIDLLKQKIASLGNVNLGAIEELKALEERSTYLSNQQTDLDTAKTQCEDLIRKLNRESRTAFEETLGKVRENFHVMFRKLFGGGRGDIIIEENVDLLEAGIDIIAKPPGKEPASISLLSGGEKTLTAIALIMSIFQLRPSPFCVMDEADAALDESNVDRFVSIIREFSATSQFLLITHNKRTMTAANVIYGVTMQTPGVSKKVSVRLEEVEPMLEGAPA